MFDLTKIKRLLEKEIEIFKIRFQNKLLFFLFKGNASKNVKVNLVKALKM